MYYRNYNVRIRQGNCIFKKSNFNILLSHNLSNLIYFYLSTIKSYLML